MRLRSPAASLVDDSGALEFDASIDAKSDGTFEGSVVIRDPTHPVISRSVRGDRCDEVVAALAVIISLTIDREEREKDSDFPPLAKSAQLEGTEGGEQRAQSALTNAGQPPDPQRLAEVGQAAAPIPPMHNARKPASDPLFVGVGAQSNWMTQLAPSGGMLLLGAHIEIIGVSGPSFTVSQLIGPSVQRVGNNGVKAESTYYGGEAEFDYPVYGNKRLGLAALAVGAIGQLRARALTQGKVNFSNETGFVWLGLGPGVGGYYRFSHLKLSIRLMTPFSLVRPQLLVASGASTTVYYEVPRITANLGISVTWESNNMARENSQGAK